MRLRGWKIAGLALVGTACVLVTACGGGGDEKTPAPSVQVIINSPSGSTTSRPRRTPTPSVSPTATPLEVCAPNPDPASPAVLQIEEPRPEAQVRIPVHIRGWGSNIVLNPTATPTPAPTGDTPTPAPSTSPTPPPRGGVTLSVVDQKQTVVQVNELPPQPREYRVPPRGLTVTDNTRPFAADIVLPNVTEATPYCLWVYLSTTETGRAQQVVQVPVVILPPLP